MKKVVTFIAVALLAWYVEPAKAQDDMFFENAFPVSGENTATNFYPIWLDDGTIDYYPVTPIVQDLRPNGTYGVAPAPNTGERFIDVWSSTYVFNAVSGNGALGQIATGYLDLTSAQAGWGGGGFNLLGSQTPPPIDLTAITDDYRFHMAVRKTTVAPCEIWLFGGGDATGAADAAQEARFCVGSGSYADTGDENLTPNFTLNTWQVIDIPVSKLRTLASGEASGWNNRAPITSGYYFAYQFGGDNNNLQMDAIFYYKPLSESAIANVQAENARLNVLVTNKTVNVLNATAPVEVYDLTGAKVKVSQQPVFGTDELSKGIYIIKSGNAVAKVVIR
ncbi:MAG: T9SS type A sorting domain-containing protein [Candidatus Azobacteroides sp.]|nr:T9SS type A sorting domain-containing protein [Candidatus Azobacteroides sp.]